MEPLTESRVGPVVEGNITQLVDMVKHVGRTGNMTESQNRRMVGYLGNLDDMRSQIVIMVQRYEEDDGKVLKRLLELLDRIDDVKQLALAAEENISDEATFVPDKDIIKKYDTPFNPLMVSTLNILDVSGLFASEIRDKDLEELEEEDDGDGDQYWDQVDDPSLLAPGEPPQDISSINLSVSNLFLPSLFDSSSAIQPPAADATSSETQKGKGKTKGKGKAVHFRNASDSEVVVKDRKGKGKAKERRAPTTKQVSFNRSDSSGSESDSEGEINGAELPKKVLLGWRRTLPTHMSSSSASSSASSSSASSSSRNPPPQRPRSTSETSSSDISSSASSSGSESESGSEPEASSSNGAGAVPHPPPLPRFGGKKARHQRKTGHMDAPVLCKICYDEYDRYEQIYKFKQCEHAYCRECLADYLTTNINEGAVLDLVCPFPDCETEVHPDEIKDMCTAETFNKYEKFTVLAALRADPNARWCPSPNCNNGIKHDPVTMPWVHCNDCKLEFCFHCMGERHDGAACGKEALEFLKKKRESEAEAFSKFTEWAGVMKAHVKPCPTCNAFIEKNDGCNHMTCGNPTCRAQFCWLCLNLYTGDHFIDDINFPDCYDKQYWTPPDLEYPPMPPPPPIPRTRRFANIAKKVGIYMGVGVAVVTLGVPAAVIGGPVYGCFQLHKRLKRSRTARRYHQARGNWIPPTPERIAEAQREARRLYDLEHS